MGNLEKQQNFIVIILTKFIISVIKASEINIIFQSYKHIKLGDILIFSL